MAVFQTVGIRKKYITIAALLAAGIAFANAATIQPDIDYSNPAKWVYVWTGDSSGDWSTGTNWERLESSETSALIPGDYKPVTSDAAFIGYTFDGIIDGKQTFTSTTDQITVTATSSLGGYAGHVYLGENANVNFDMWTDYGALTIHLGANSVVSFTRDMGLATGAVLDYGTITGNNKVNFQKLWQDGKTTYLTGNYTLGEGGRSSVELGDVHFAGGSVSGFDASGIVVTDLLGNTLEYVTDTSALKEGEFGLSYADGSVSLVAWGAIPEPSAFGLLAGLGALALVGARRRRK